MRSAEDNVGFGVQHYREGSLMRLSEAHQLYCARQWVGCIYLGGRAVEAILRALYWLKSGQHDKGHDLRGSLTAVRGVFGRADEVALDNAINEVAIVWRNDLRFTG